MLTLYTEIKIIRSLKVQWRREMKNIPILDLPENFCIAVMSYDSTYDDGGIECLLVNQVGLSHANIIDLDDLPKNQDKKIDLVIYIHKSRKVRKVSEFLETFNRFKEKFIGVPALKVNIKEGINKRVLKVQYFSRNLKFQNIINVVVGHLKKMYNITLVRY